MLKRIVLTLVFLTASFGLALFVPHAFGRVRSVDQPAAASLSERERADIGPTLVGCMNEPDSSRFSENGYDPLTAHNDLGGDWSDDYYVISGRIGWHVTWQVLLPLDSEPITAYDTIASEPIKALFRRDLPWKVIGSLKRCGVEFGGDWPTNLPDNLSPFEGF
jgi:hypothetical protein